MNNKIVLVLYDNTWDIDDIKKDLKEERYPHYFLFSLINCDINDIDEVWTFGDVSDDEIYKLALTNNVEVWEMA